MFEGSVLRDVIGQHAKHTTRHQDDEQLWVATQETEDSPDRPSGCPAYVFRQTNRVSDPKLAPRHVHEPILHAGVTLCLMHLGQMMPRDRACATASSLEWASKARRTPRMWFRTVSRVMLSC